ncbi:MAG: monoamine oxidase [Cellvibrionaceae bacterium]|jgi:monoamine oxidase
MHRIQKIIEADVIIIGAGLSGLTAATHLKQAGKRVAILEARERIGGRIHTVLTDNQNDQINHGFDLGPAWFWPHQQNITNLLQQLGLAQHEQYEIGNSLFEQQGALPQTFTPNWQQPASFRIVGGTIALVNRLAEELLPDTIHLNHIVNKISTQADGRCEISTTTEGTQITWIANHVIVTLPPHLAATTIAYDPPLPAELSQVMRNTPTWMGEAMKVSLVYEKPFWREANLSGMAISYAGPVQQFHDASPADLRLGALFGWVGHGVGSGSSARQLSAEARQTAVIQQAVRLFGPQAAHPLIYAETNWEHEPFTTNLGDPDRAIAQQHPHYGHPALQPAQMDGRLWWATTEASPVEGGYLDGAIFIGRSVASQIIDIKKPTSFKK